MSTWKAIRCRDPLRVLALAALLVPPAPACSCAWRGPFLKVAGEAPLIVRGRVLRHKPGTVPTMDVQVLETLAGGVLDSGLEIQMDNGAMCRPPIGLFPVGSEWILALNGPGSKPGNGLAISICGEYWLRVEGGEAVGSLDGPRQQTRRMPLEELRQRLRHPAFAVTFSGRVEGGKPFRRSLPGAFVFVLDPSPEGWEIRVVETDGEADLARLTPPLHGLPNPREIEAWQFQEPPPGCPRPYRGAPPPAETRDFIFSPEVGRGIQGPHAHRAVTVGEVEAVRRFGRGTLRITKAQVEPGPGGCPRLASLDFEVELSGGF